MEVRIVNGSGWWDSQVNVLADTVAKVAKHDQVVTAGEIPNVRFEASGQAFWCEATKLVVTGEIIGEGDCRVIPHKVRLPDGTEAPPASGYYTQRFRNLHTNGAMDFSEVEFVPQPGLQKIAV